MSLFFGATAGELLLVRAHTYAPILPFVTVPHRCWQADNLPQVVETNPDELVRDLIHEIHYNEITGSVTLKLRTRDGQG